MRKPRRARCLGAVVASFGLAACAGETALEPESPDPTSPTGTAARESTLVMETLPAAEPTNDDRTALAAVVEAINQAQRERRAATDEFQDAESGLLTIVEAYERLYATEIEVLDRLIVQLMGDIADLAAARAHAAVVEATRTLRDQTQSIAGRIAERRDEFEATSSYSSQQGAPAPDLAALAQAQVDAFERWQTVCFEFQTALIGVVEEPLDCTGVGRRAGVEASGDTASEAPADDGTPVTVSLECRRGIGTDALPFDPDPYPWIRDASPDHGWILSSLVIVNPTDEWVRLVDDFHVQFFDDEGASLASIETPEGFPPALIAAPGQTVHRNGFTPEQFARGRRGEELGPDLVQKIFRQSETCDFVDTDIEAVDPAELIDDEFVDHVEIIGCAADEASGRWLVDYRVTNPFDQPIRVAISTELVDSNGDRLGMAGIGNSDGRIGPEEIVELQGWSVFYTIEDVGAVDRCELFTVEFGID